MDNIFMRWLLSRSLTQQITMALLLMFAAAAGSVGVTLYELQLRKHDYIVLDLAGELRALAQSMVRESVYFIENAADPRARLTFSKNLQRQAESFDRIVSGLQNRYLESDLTGLDEPLVCSWDEFSTAQLDLAGRTWQEFRGGINAVFAEKPGAKSLRQAADFVLANEDWVIVVAANLSKAFQQMMEDKMELISRFNQYSLAFSLFAMIALLFLLHHSFISPVRQSLIGVERIANGDFGYQIPQQGSREVGQIIKLLNLFSRRIHSIFKLTDRISQASTLSESLRFVFDEFRTMLPMDWVGILELDSSGERFVLQHRFTEGETELQEGDSFRASGTLLGKAMAERQPLHLPDLVARATEDEHAEFAAHLARDGRRSALFFPLASEGEWAATLVFAVSIPDAYTQEHVELLGNIALQVAHGFEKTVVTENLVITAVTGLAKLAESRDSETGNHLVRMARYAAIIAEELGENDGYREQIGPDLVRDIFRFAPMHDIGKVGISDSILLKAGELGSEEWHEMRRHPEIGGEVLRRCEQQMNAVGHSVFKVAIDIAECHHERFDGQGYPKGIKGMDIPLTARIVTVADTFDALTSKRPYKEAWSVDKALVMMMEERGKQFDPDAVDALVKAIPRIMEVYEQLRHV